MDDIAVRNRAANAQQLLDNELLTEALGRVEKAAIEALAGADVSDARALQRATAELQAARALRADLQSLVRTGKLSERTPLAVA